ncbi:MAG: response regulator [Novosphingobium sp.]|nr:response regulator [Novosphingobium sp.]
MTSTVLLLEDEILVALDIEDIVGEIGHAVDGPHVSVEQGLQALENGMPDCAILDVQLKDGEVYPVADKLHEAGVPIIFHSGHADAPTLRERYPGALVCGKPCAPSTLQQSLRQALGQD